MQMENLIHDMSDEKLFNLYAEWKQSRHHTGFITDDMPLLRETVDAYSSTLEKLHVNTSPVHVVDDHLLEELADRWAANYINDPTAKAGGLRRETKASPS